MKWRSPPPQSTPKPIEEDEKDDSSIDGELGPPDQPLGQVRVPGWDTDSLEEQEDDPDTEKLDDDPDAAEYENVSGYNDEASEEEAAEDDQATEDREMREGKNAVFN